MKSVNFREKPREKNLGKKLIPYFSKNKILGVYIRMGMVKRLYNKAKKAVKKRYVSKGGNLKVSRLYKDVRYLKSVLNPEKKRITTKLDLTTLGQVDGNYCTPLVIDVTPDGVTSGAGYNQRTGASIKLHSTHYQIQMEHQHNTVGEIKYKMMWICPKGQAVLNANINPAFMTDMFEQNPFITGSTNAAIDYNSPRNPDFFSNYKVIRQVNGIVKDDATSSEKVVKTFNVGFKYNKGKGHHVRFDRNSSGTDSVLAGQIILVVMISRGNKSISTTSTMVGIPDTQVQTGLTMTYNRVDYFYDN